MANAGLEVIQEAGHFLQEDQPEAVAQRILKFLNDADSAIL